MAELQGRARGSLGLVGESPTMALWLLDSLLRLPGLAGSL